jgi:hypothetical protein
LSIPHSESVEGPSFSKPASSSVRFATANAPYNCRDLNLYLEPTSWRREAQLVRNVSFPDVNAFLTVTINRSSARVNAEIFF